LYSSPDIIRQIKSRRMRWVVHVACMGGEKCAQGFGHKSKRKEATQKTNAQMRAWVKMDLRETTSEGVEWIHLVQDRDQWQALVNTVIKLQVLAPQS
jgi:hypothetical protein